MGGCGLDSSGSCFGHVAGCCEYGNEPVGPGNFLIAEELLVFRNWGVVKGGGVCGLRPPPHITHRNSINTDFVDWMISNLYVIYPAAEIY